MIPPDGVVGLDLRMGLSIDLTLYSRMRCPKTHSVTELRDCPDVGGWGGGGGGASATIYGFRKCTEYTE
jgi:hypothetical protein